MTQPPPLPESARNLAATCAEAPPSRSAKFTGIAKVVAAVWKFGFAVVLSQSLLLSVLVVGWVTRAMQRAVYKRWWKGSEARRQGLTFPGFVQSFEPVQCHAQWPNFFLAQKCGGVRLSLGGHRFFGSLVENAVRGVQMIFNTWVLTMPACVTMLFSWAYGWNNSFTKGYELAPVGPATGLLGVALFIAAMLYVPMAQAHQAATGNWRMFYQWRVVWRIARHRWLASLLLATAYTVISVPIALQKIQPYYFAQMKKLPADTLANFTPAEVEHHLHAYYLGAGILVVGGYLLLRLLAARTYAVGVVQTVRVGDIPPYALTSVHLAMLDRLGYLKVNPPAQRRPVLDFAGRMLSLAARSAAWFAFLLVWFAFVAQIYIAQFFNHLPVVGWLNQPLVQLPWIKYVPHRVTGELWTLVIVALVALAIAALRSSLRRLRATPPFKGG